MESNINGKNPCHLHKVNQAYRKPTEAKKRLLCTQTTQSKRSRTVKLKREATYTLGKPAEFP